MPDLPISALPLATTVTTSDPLAVVVGGTTSRATVNTLLTAFTVNPTKPLPAGTDEVMIYDGTLLKTSVNQFLTAFVGNPAKTNVGLTDEMMIYDGSLLTTSVNSLLTALTQYSGLTLSPTSTMFAFDTDLGQVSVNDVLETFTQNTQKATPDLTDEVMIYDGDLLKTTINDTLETFNQNSIKSTLAGDEEVMIYDPTAGSLLKTTIDDITGSIISPTHYIYYFIEPDQDELTYRVMSVGASGSFNTTFTFPPDMTSLTSVNLIISPDGSSGVGKQIQFNAAFGNPALGQTLTDGGGDDTKIFTFPADQTFFKLDITDIFMTPLATRDATGGDVVGLETNHQGLGGATDYFTVEVIYEGPGGSGTTILVIDNLTSTSTTDALSANQGRVLNENKQDISTLQTDIEALNFNTLTVVDTPVNPNDATNKTYVDSVANPITVIDNLTSTSATDALSANQGRVLDTTKLNISDLETSVEGINFNTLTVVDTPTMTTDVTNKAYVDGAIPAVIDALTSTSTTDALSANQGNVLDTDKLSISDIKTEVEAVNFDDLTVVNAPVNNTDVANKEYVDTSSGGITVIDNLTSTSATDALSANQGRVLNINKQDISTLQSDIESLNFDELTVVDPPVNATDVANKDYVDNSSGGIIVIDNLTSTSSTDALSANQGRILNINKQDIATLQSDIQAINFPDLTVTNAPVAGTDVANKDYVDSSGGGVTVIDNLTSTSATDALSANQGRVLNENKQEISTLTTTIEGLTFNNLTVNAVPTILTHVTNKDYVDGEIDTVEAQIPAVIDNLTSTSTTDALSANQGRLLDVNKQDISTLQTDIEALSFSDLTVTNAPVNATDVANKAYVDAGTGGGTVTLNKYIPAPNPDTVLISGAFQGQLLGPGDTMYFAGAYDFSLNVINIAKVQYVAVSGPGPINVQVQMSQAIDSVATTTNSQTQPIGISPTNVYREFDVSVLFASGTNNPIPGYNFNLGIQNLAAVTQIAVIGLSINTIINLN